MTAPKPRRRTIRSAIFAVVCLLLGAVTTVGSAWWLGNPARVELQMSRDRVPYPDRTDRAFPYRLLWREVHTNAASWQFAVVGTSTREEWDETQLDAGWPCLALRSVQHANTAWYGAARPDRWRFLSWTEGLVAPVSWQGGAHHCLPAMPLFPGFALDTALYAAAWYLLIFTPLPLIRAGRRRFRVSRGMCGSCGYDLSASTNRPCPECGA